MLNRHVLDFLEGYALKLSSSFWPYIFIYFLKFIHSLNLFLTYRLMNSSILAESWKILNINFQWMGANLPTEPSHLALFFPHRGKKQQRQEPGKLSALKEVEIDCFRDNIGQVLLTNLWPTICWQRPSSSPTSAFLSRINRPEGLMVCKAHIFIFAGILFRGLETEVLTVFHSL